MLQLETIETVEIVIYYASPKKMDCLYTGNPFSKATKTIFVSLLHSYFARKQLLAHF
jgi:hypothetical protein